MSTCIGITPVYRSTLEYVNKQRLEHFNQLGHVVDVIRIVDCIADDESADYPLEKMVGMYLLESKVLTVTAGDAFASDLAKHFTAIVTAVSRMDFSPCDTYWISRNFCNLIQVKVNPLIQKLVRNDLACFRGYLLIYTVPESKTEVSRLISFQVICSCSKLIFSF